MPDASPTTKWSKTGGLVLPTMIYTDNAPLDLSLPGDAPPLARELVI